MGGDEWMRDRMDAFCWNGMREELRETAQERSAEWKARHDSDPKE